jgi:PAS domain-containing protein
MSEIEDLKSQIESLKKRITELERIEKAVEAAGFDIWENNFVTGEVFGTNRRTFLSLGYSETELPVNLEETFRYIHPDDLDAALKTMLDHIDGKIDSYQAEMRLKAGNGSWVWIGNYGKVIERTPDGKAICFTGVSFNINQRRIVEEALIEQNNELRKAIEHIKTLQGIIPICSHCKKIRNDEGYWNQVEDYIAKHADVQFSHSICPDCMKIHYKDHLYKTGN